MEIVIWATCEDGEYGPQPTAFYTGRELAKRSVVKQWQESDEAERTDYAETWDEIQVKRQMGIPVQEVRMYSGRLGFRPKWRNEPDGDLQLMAWKVTGAYGPGWEPTGWLVEKITARDKIDSEEVSGDGDSGDSEARDGQVSGGSGD